MTKLSKFAKQLTSVQSRPVQPGIQGNTGFDNLRENIDPHLKTKTINVKDTIKARGISLNIVTKTSNYNATSSDHVIIGNATSASFTITLPPTLRGKGIIYHIKKIDSSGNTITLDGNASETIDGETTKVISVQYDNVMLISDGSNWHII